MKNSNILDNLVKVLGADSWNKKISYTGQLHYQIRKKGELVEEYSSIYEAEFRLKYGIKNGLFK